MPRKNKRKHEFPTRLSNTKKQEKTQLYMGNEEPGCSGVLANVRRISTNVNPLDSDKLQRLFEEASSSSLSGSSVHDVLEESERSADEQDIIPRCGISSDESGSREHDPYSDSAGEYGSDSEYNPDEDADSDRTMSDIPDLVMSASQANLPIDPDPVIGYTSIQTLDDNINPIEPNNLNLIEPNDINLIEPNDINLIEPNDINLIEPNDVNLRYNPNSTLNVVIPHSPNRDNILAPDQTLPAPPSQVCVRPSLLHQSVNDRSFSFPYNIEDPQEHHQSHQNVSSPTNITSDWEENTEPILEFEFDVTNAGAQVNLDGNTKPIQVLNHLFTDEMVDFIVSCTNAYGEALCSSNRPHTRGSRIQSFKPTDKMEIKKFLGLCLLQGHMESPSIRKYFTVTDPLYYHPIFSFSMSGRRFEQLLRCLCISDLDAKGMSKIKHFANKVINNFQNFYHPDKELSLDESLLQFRGRLSFRQYIKSKKARYGIKFYVLTTHDGYVLNFIIYEGKNTLDEGGDGSKTAKLVFKLMQPYLDKGHDLYMDNFYNSIDLSKKLLFHKTHTTGTLRKDRKGNPKTLFGQKIKKGDHVWRRKGNVYVSVWKDKRVVYMVTTKHHPRLVITRNRYGQPKKKPIEVSEYNKYMSGIDKSDQMMAYYSTPKKTIRWYKKVFFHLLDMMVWNAYYMFKKHCNSNTTLLSFRESIVNSYLQMTDNTLNEIQQMRLAKTSNRRKKKTTDNLPQAVCESGHWPELIPLTENAKRKKVFLRCRVCSKNKISKQTSYRCKGCIDKPPLCPSCFESWHMVRDEA